MDNRRLIEALGSGIKFPEIFNDVRGHTNIEEGRDKIKQSIEDILEVRVGEKFGSPNYGSRLYEIVFEPNDRIAKDLVKEYVIDALNRWEDRIEIDSIDVMQEDNEMYIRINYRIGRTNIRDYYEYTLLREEGE